MGKTTFKDRIGERYGRLLVLSKAPSKHGYARWNCVCDCGRYKEVSGTSLQQEKIKSCGCLRKETCALRASINSENNKLLPGESAFLLLYNVYKHNAEIKKREFSLTTEQFRELTSGTCVYCGLPPSSRYQTASKNGGYIYNGVDRINNSIGYVLENCATCCKTCNWMKRVQTTDEFISACQRVVNYTNHKKSTEMLDSATK
jgi:hypothetical protein